MIRFTRVRFSGVAATVKQAPRDNLPEVVMAGRSNAGKSSLINALVDHRGLAKVSSNPGKTQLVVYFNVDERFYLTDLPGYGYARTSQTRRAALMKLADAYFQADRPIALVLLLVDIRIPPTAHDRMLYDYLCQEGHPFALILAKADKLSRSAALQRQREIRRDLAVPESLPSFIVSASKKTGIKELRAFIGKVIEGEWSPGEEPESEPDTEEKGEV